MVMGVTSLMTVDPFWKRSNIVLFNLPQLLDKCKVFPVFYIADPHLLHDSGSNFSLSLCQASP